MRYTRLALCALLTFLCAPSYVSAQTTTTPPSGDVKLDQGRKIVDSKGREVTNRGYNENGRLHVHYTGKLDKSGDVWKVTGDIESVTNPSSQGTEGPITIKGDGMDITLDTNGGRGAGGAVTTTITGDSNKVHVNGDHNDFNVNGNNNTADVNGRYDNGCLTGNGNQVRLGGSHNTVTSGGTTTKN